MPDTGAGGRMTTMAISEKKLSEMVAAAKRYEAWHETDAIDSGVAFAYACRASDEVQRLAKEVRRLKEFEAKYRGLCK